MKKPLRIFVIYFPVMLVIGQVLANLSFFLIPEWYFRSAFYLNHFLGINMAIAVFFVVFTWSFKFCAVSRYASVAEFLFGLNYLIIQQDNLYNIMFQVIVGSLAVALTIRHINKTFPLCSMSLFLKFIKKVFQTGSCEEAYNKWERDLKTTVIERYGKSKRQL